MKIKDMLALSDREIKMELDNTEQRAIKLAARAKMAVGAPHDKCVHFLRKDGCEICRLLKLLYCRLEDEECPFETHEPVDALPEYLE